MTAHTPRVKNLALAHPKDGTVMKVFLTGATGYVGSAVLARLLTDGNEVVAHARSVESADRLLPGAVPAIGELTDAGWLREQVDHSGGVYRTHAVATRAAPASWRAAATPPTTPALLVDASGGETVPPRQPVHGPGRPLLRA
jgi:uncharacterized protein YbjT (DUF2867 family)